MNTLHIKSSSKSKFKYGIFRIIAIILAFAGVTISCDKYDDYKIEAAGPLTIIITKSSVVLLQKDDAKTAVNFNWTTGTNNGTGSAISYQFQCDKKGNNFANPISLSMGKNIFTHEFTTAALNDSLLKHWNAIPGKEIRLEARVIATICDTPPVTDISNITEISVTPYEPVSKTLYIIGSASPKGWSVDNALELTPQSDPTVFIYQGALSTGEFKFLTTKGQLLPSYNLGADEAHIVYRNSGNDPDNKFTITENAVYKVRVSLLDLTISVTKVDLPAYSNIYMVGSASPNGWDISNAAPLVQNSENPYIFTYTGVMQAGEFKFPVNRNSDWGQDMFMRTDDTHMYLHKGGDSDDNKWSIAKKGYYTITLNLLDNSIRIERLKLYMVGSATPAGWTITNAIEMTEDANDGCIFTYSGPMTTGEFKFPVNRNSDWGQDMYMKVDITHMYRHIGGASDDNKWNITADGNYIIKANVENLTIDIQKQ